MKVRQFISGKFHFVKYTNFIENYLNFKIIYSGKPTDSFGTNQINCWSFYTALQILVRLFPDKLFAKSLVFAYKLWELSIRREIKREHDVDLYHCLCHGFTVPVIKKYRPDSLILGHVVNAHPKQQTKLIEMSFDDFGVPVPTDKDRELIDQRIIDEANLCDYLLSPSSFVTNTYINEGFNAEKIITLSYALEKELKHNTMHFDQVFVENDTLNVVCVGQVIPRKGQLLLAKALKEIEKLGFTVTLTMYGRAEHDYLNYISKSGITINHIPHLNNKDLQKTLSNYDLFVLPSYEDGFAVAVTEAISAGLPVIVSTAVGAADILSNKSSSVFGVGNQLDLETKIRGFLNGEYRETIENVYDWKGYSERLFKVYSELIKNNNAI